jgi:membrane protease YdiL (CAAX protease family)
MKTDFFNFAFLFQVLLSLLLLGSVYFCLRHRTASKVYWNFGKNMAALFVLVELLTLMMQGAIVTASFIIPFHFISITLSVMGGMMLARRLRQPSLPLLTSFTRARKDHSGEFWKDFIKPVLIYAPLICIFTFFLFKFTQPEMSDFIKEAAEAQGKFKAQVEISSIIFFLLVAFYEEVLFRLFIQTFLSYILRKFALGSFLALIGSSFLFAIGHFGILATWWVKFVQTFTIGIVLGHIMKRHGMEASFGVHAILNIFALYTSSILMEG